MLYTPGFDANRNRVAVDPRTGATTFAALIGKYVPGSGDYANGMKAGGVDGYRWGLYGVPALSATPRFGFAYDVFGQGKTVLRGGIGVFLDRSRQLLNGGTANNPPVSYRPTLFYGNLDTFAKSQGAIGPSAAAFVFPAEKVQMPSVASFSFGLQQQLPFSSVLDVSYVGSASSHLLQARNLNQIPMYSRFDPEERGPDAAGQTAAGRFPPALSRPGRPDRQRVRLQRQLPLAAGARRAPLHARPRFRRGLHVVEGAGRRPAGITKPPPPTSTSASGNTARSLSTARTCSR